MFKTFTSIPTWKETAKQTIGLIFYWSDLVFELKEFLTKLCVPSLFAHFVGFSHLFYTVHCALCKTKLKKLISQIFVICSYYDNHKTVINNYYLCINFVIKTDIMLPIITFKSSIVKLAFSSCFIHCVHNIHSL